MDFLRAQPSEDEDLPGGDFQVLEYHTSRSGSIGFTFKNGSTEYCCTRELQNDPEFKSAHSKSCDVDRVVIENQQDGDKLLQVTSIVFEDGKTSPKHRIFRKFNVIESGTHYVMFAFCDPNVPAVLASGCIEWRNYYGFLPAALHGIILFHFVMTLAYLGIGLVWFIMCAMYWRDILGLQGCIAGVLGVGMFEQLLWHSYYKDFNATGYSTVGLMIFSVLAQTLKRDVSRLLVLVVSMGYGVVRRSLGTTTYKVFLLGVVFFIFSAAHGVDQARDHSTEPSVIKKIILAFPIALINVTIALWIFFSMTRTMARLTERKQLVKLSLYRRFFIVLAVLIVLSVGWHVLEIWAFSPGVLETYFWDKAWIFTKDAFWEVFFFLMLLSVMIIWRPSANNMRYAYNKVEDEDEQRAATTDVELNVPLIEKGHNGAAAAEPSSDAASLAYKFTLDDDIGQESKMD